MSRRSHEVRPRWMRQTDAADVLYVERSAFGKTRGDVHQLLEWVAKPTSLAVVAEKHHRIVGFLLARCNSKTQTVRIVNVAVHPHHRRRQAPALLFAFLFQHLEQYPTYIIETLAPERALDYIEQYSINWQACLIHFLKILFRRRTMHAE